MNKNINTQPTTSLDQLEQSVTQEIQEKIEQDKQFNSKSEGDMEENEEQNSGRGYPHFNLIQQSMTVLSKVMPEMFPQDFVNEFYQQLFQKISNQLNPTPLQREAEVKEENIEIEAISKFIEEDVNQQFLNGQQDKNTLEESSLEKSKENELAVKARKDIYHEEEDKSQKQKGRGKTQGQIAKRKEREEQKEDKPDYPWREQLVKPNQKRPCKNVKYELHQNWNNQYQAILLNQYIEGNNFTQIREHLIQAYPKQAKLFDLHSLKSVFYKIMRMALKRLKHEIANCTSYLTPMVELEEQLVFNILYCGGQSYNIRVLLAELLQQPIPASTESLNGVITGINQFFKNGGGIKRSLCKPHNKYP